MRVLVSFMVLASTPGYSQPPAPTILRINAESYLRYVYDGSPSEIWALQPVLVPLPPRRPTDQPEGQFWSTIGLGDVSLVNGTAVKGTVSEQSTFFLTQAEFPRTATSAAPFNRDGLVTFTVEIADDSDRSIGSLIATGLVGGRPPAGITATRPQGWAPPIWNMAIIGGTGAFVGARGQLVSHTSQAVMQYTSVQTMTTPSVRRRISSSRLRLSAYIIPETRPEVARSDGVPAVYHEDFSPVSAANPARPGEILILQATGLGPTDPGVDPGQRFPIDPLLEVLAPVSVLANGQSAEVRNKVGWPGPTDRYRIDVRMPAGVSRSATLQIEAAWIPGGAVVIPVQ